MNASLDVSWTQFTYCNTQTHWVCLIALAWFNIKSSNCHPAPCYLNTKKLFPISNDPRHNPEQDSNLGLNCALTVFELCWWVKGRFQYYLKINHVQVQNSSTSKPNQLSRPGNCSKPTKTVRFKSTSESWTVWLTRIFKYFWNILKKILRVLRFLPTIPLLGSGMPHDLVKINDSKIERVTEMGIKK